MSIVSGEPPSPSFPSIAQIEANLNSSNPLTSVNILRSQDRSKQTPSSYCTDGVQVLLPFFQSDGRTFNHFLGAAVAYRSIDGSPLVMDLLTNKIIPFTQIKRPDGTLYWQINVGRGVLANQGIKVDSGIETISREHAIICCDKQGFWVVDKSTSGTGYRDLSPSVISQFHTAFREGQKRFQKFGFAEVVARPHHMEQQIQGDSHSYGGDYYLTHQDFYEPRAAIRQELIGKRGELYILMDTATISGESLKTRQFAQAFMNYYYNNGDFTNPRQMATYAYQHARKTVGEIPSTFNYVVKTPTAVYADGVGNGTVVLIHNNGQSEYLYNPEGKTEAPLYLDTNDNVLSDSDQIFYRKTYFNFLKVHNNNDDLAWRYFHQQYPNVSRLIPTHLISSEEFFEGDSRPVSISSNDRIAVFSDGHVPQGWDINRIKTNTSTGDDATLLLI